MMSCLSDRLASRLSDFQQAFSVVIAGTANPALLQEAVSYATLSGGKRIRPYILLSIGENLGVSTKQLIPAAIAVEMVHCYSLVHDDLPAMDDDDLRRGQPTVHRAFDEATAILAGDALLSESFAVLARDQGISAQDRIALVALLAQASGGHGMVAGQVLDLALEGNREATEADIAQVQERKTGAIFVYCATAPAILADLPNEKMIILKQFGQSLGTLFQLSDDIIGATVSSEISGKSSESDARNDKMNWVRLLGLSECLQRCDALVEKCLFLLQSAGSYDEALAQTIRDIARRQH